MSLFAVNVSAANFELLGQQSILSYEVLKFGSIYINGELSSDSKAELKGSLTLTDFKELSDLKGKITLSNSVFKSGSYQRDLAVKEIINSDVIIEVEKVYSYRPNDSLANLSIKLNINGVSDLETTQTKILLSDNLIQVIGKFNVNRKKYGLVFKKGFAGQFDPAIAEQFTLSYHLVFNTEPETFKLLKSTMHSSSTSSALHKDETATHTEDIGVIQKVKLFFSRLLMD